jgi:hypothetical protein
MLLCGSEAVAAQALEVSRRFCRCCCYSSLLLTFILTATTRVSHFTHYATYRFPITPRFLPPARAPTSSLAFRPCAPSCFYAPQVVLQAQIQSQIYQSTIHLSLQRMAAPGMISKSIPLTPTQLVSSYHHQPTSSSLLHFVPSRFLTEANIVAAVGQNYNRFHLYFVFQASLCCSRRLHDKRSRGGWHWGDLPVQVGNIGSQAWLGRGLLFFLEICQAFGADSVV